MMDQLDNGKGFLKEKLGGYRVDPPENIWVSISSRLGGNRRRTLVIISLSAAAAIALAVSLGINLFGPDPAKIEKTAILEDEGITQGTDRGRTLSRETTTETGMTTAPGEAPVTGRNALQGQIRDDDTSEQIPAPGDIPVKEEIRVAEKIHTPGRKLEELAKEVLTKVLPEREASELALKPLTEPRIRSITQIDTSFGNPAELSTKPLVEPFTEAATESGKRSERARAWMIGASLSPLYSYRDAENAAMTGISDYESGLFSYSGGVHVGYLTGSRLAIESGIYYNRMGISLGASGIRQFDRSFDFTPLAEELGNYDIMAISNSVGNIVSKSGDIFVNNYKLNARDEAEAIKFASTEIYTDRGIRQQLDYLELPFNIRYTLVNRDIELQVVGGVSANLLVNSDVRMDSPEGYFDIGYLTNIRNLNYSGNAGLGVVYHFHESFNLRLEPRFKYFLNSINDQTLPSTRPYAFGIFTGLSYMF